MKQIENSLKINGRELQLIQEYLFSKLYKSKNGNIIKMIEIPKQEYFQREQIQYEISKQQQFAKGESPISLDIIEYIFESCDGKDYLTITYDCDLTCRPLLEFTQGVSNEKKIQICSQILRICAILQERQITHGNIKPSNLFYYKDQVLLSDFGSSRTFHKVYKKQFEQKDKQQWQANCYYFNCEEYLKIIHDTPDCDMRNEDWDQILSDQKQQIFADTWALGIIALEIFSCNQLKFQQLTQFYGLNKLGLKKQINLLKLQGFTIIQIVLTKWLIMKESVQSVLSYFMENVNQQTLSQSITSSRKSIKLPPKCGRYSPAQNDYSLNDDNRSLRKLKQSHQFNNRNCDINKSSNLGFNSFQDIRISQMIPQEPIQKSEHSLDNSQIIQFDQLDEEDIQNDEIINSKENETEQKNLLSKDKIQKLETQMLEQEKVSMTPISQIQNTEKQNYQIIVEMIEESDIIDFNMLCQEEMEQEADEQKLTTYCVEKTQQNAFNKNQFVLKIEQNEIQQGWDQLYEIFEENNEIEQDQNQLQQILEVEPQQAQKDVLIDNEFVLQNENNEIQQGQNQLQQILEVEPQQIQKDVLINNEFVLQNENNEIQQGQNQLQEILEEPQQIQKDVIIDNEFVLQNENNEIQQGQNQLQQILEGEPQQTQKEVLINNEFVLQNEQNQTSLEQNQISQGNQQNQQSDNKENEKKENYSKSDTTQEQNCIFNFDLETAITLQHSLIDLFSTIFGQNYFLKQFTQINLVQKIDYTLDFQTIRKLNLSECEKYLSQLQEMLKFFVQKKDNQEKQRQLNEQNINKTKGNIFNIEQRIRALKTLKNEIEDPEPEILYFLNPGELIELQDSLTSLSNCTTLNYGIIQQQLELQYKVSFNEQALNVDEMELISIEELVQKQKFINSTKLNDIIKQKKQDERKYGIQQFPFYNVLYVRANYEVFMNTGNLNSKLTQNQILLLNRKLQTKYKQQLIILCNQSRLQRENYLNAIFEISQKLDYIIVQDQIKVKFSFSTEWLTVQPVLQLFFKQIFTPTMLVPYDCWNLIAQLDEVRDGGISKNYCGYCILEEPHGLGLKQVNENKILYGIFCLGQIRYGQEILLKTQKQLILYTGNFMDGQKQGTGCMKTYQLKKKSQFEIISQYEGEFQGQFHGRGILTDYQKKTIYEGEFLNDLFHGQGIMYENFEKTQYRKGTYIQGNQLGSHEIYQYGKNICVKQISSDKSVCSVM